MSFGQTGQPPPAQLCIRRHWLQTSFGGHSYIHILERYRLRHTNWVAPNHKLPRDTRLPQPAGRGSQSAGHRARFHIA